MSTPRLALPLALLTLVACAGGSPARRAAERAALDALTRLESRRDLTQLAVVGGLRPAGTPAAATLAEDHADPLAEELGQALEATLQERGLRVVDHRNMPLALDVLKVEMTDLFPEDETGEQTLRRLGRYLKADLYVTGSYTWLDQDPPDLLLDLRILDLHTLELLASGEGRSRDGWQRVGGATLTGLAVITTPIPAVWDMLVHATERSYGAEGLEGWALLKAIGLWPVHLLASPALTDWPATRWWLDLDPPPPPPTDAEA